MGRLTRLTPRRHPGWRRFWLLGPGLLYAGAALWGARPQPRAILPVWPPPPEVARIAYVQSISKPSDAGARQSGFRRFSNWIAGADEGNEPLDRPFALSLDDQDNLCLTDTAANVVCCLDRATRRWYRWEQAGNVRFVAPVGVVRQGKTMYVADSGLPALLAFELDGRLRFRTSEELERPTGLVISGDRLYVADSARHRIAMFDLRGKYLGGFGQRGDGPGEFNFPTHVAADARGRIYVTDAMNGRVQVFDGKGGFQRQLGRPGDGPGSFSRPKGVAVDAAGLTYVVDAVFDNFQIFDADSRLLLDVGRPGAGPGEFWLPNGIAVGRDQRIYVADCYNSRVQVFQHVGPK